MTTDFLSQKPDKAIVQIKDILYARLMLLKSDVPSDAVVSEINFLYTLLDMIERS